MKREIKFRAWGGQQREHFEFVYFSLLGGGIDRDECVVADIPDETGGNLTLDVQDIRDVQQFTGLTDRNGKEIYEGDVVEYQAFSKETIVAEVVYDIDQALWEPMVYDWDSFWSALSSDCEVIGNIYENPELLES